MDNIGVGVCAGSLMMKWNVLDDHFKQINFKYDVGDKVNVFISFESIMKNLIRYRNINTIAFDNKQEFVIEIESSILNLMANYKMYFKRLNMDPTIYLYATDIGSDSYYCADINKYYRNYYKNIFTQNPKYSEFTKVLRDIIIPEVRLIVSYVPQCHFVYSTNIDSICIPKMISMNSDSHNIIITTDIFDTLYMFDSNFITLYIKRKYADISIKSTSIDMARMILGDTQEYDEKIFNHELYYRLLLSVKGSEYRNIKSSFGFGINRFIGAIVSGVNNDKILYDFKSIESVIDAFPEKYSSGIQSSMQLTSVDNQYNMIPDADIHTIKDSLIDNVDNGSLESLNNRRFNNHPINLIGLI